MNIHFAKAILVWGLGPMMVCAAATAVGWAHVTPTPQPFFDAPLIVSSAQQAALEGAVTSTISNAVWAFADAATAKQIMQSEMDRLGETPGAENARALIRFALLDTNPDGQKALFARACLVDPATAKDWQAAAVQQTKMRFVAPGNSLPVSMIEGHPPIGGPR